MKKPQVFLLIFIVLSVFYLNSCKAPSKPQDEWISLFNGVDMQGWTVKIKGYDAGDNFGNTFRVEDSILKVRYDAYENFDNRFGHLYYKDTFSHYIIRLQYRFTGDQCPGAPGWAIRNSGIMVHGQTVETIDKDQDFPVSIEVQLLGGDGTNERTTGNLCTPGTNVVMDGELRLVHCTSSTSKTYHGDQWVTAEVEVHGGQIIKHIINGDTVLVYSEPQLDDRDPSYAKLLPADGNKILTRGTISLQSEGHPVEFRKVELKILEK